MVYPAAGVPCSTGSAWCSSYSLTTTLGSPGTDTNVASEKAVRSAIAAAVSAITASSLGLATVAASGSYLDLSNKPTIPAAQVNSDWNASSGLAQILNKPTVITSVFGNSGPVVGAVGDIGATGAVIKVNGGSLPTSAPLVGTNSSGQVIAANSPTITGPLKIAPTGGGAGAIDYLCGTSPSSPSTGYITPFCDSANSNHLSVVDSAGIVKDLQAASGGADTGAMIYQTANQSIPSNALTTTALGSVLKDSGGFTGITANSLVVPSGDGGWYMVSGGGCWASASGNTQINLNVNGSRYPQASYVLSQPSPGFCGTFSINVYLNAGDTITMPVYQYTGGGALNLFQAWFGAVRVN